MLFFKLIAFLLPLTILASPLVNHPAKSRAKRDYATVSAVLNNIIKQCNELVEKSKSFNGEAIDAVPILDASEALLKMMKEGQGKISDTESIGLMNSIQVLYPVYNLNTAVNNVVNMLMEKKPMFDKAGVTIVVADKLEEEKGAAQELVTAVVAKLPAYVPGVIGTTAAQPILDKLDRAVAAFKEASPAAASPEPASPSAASPEPASPSAASPEPTSSPAASPATPAAASPAMPAMPASESTASPASPAPASPAPASPAPASPAPASPAPASPAPASPAPATTRKRPVGKTGRVRWGGLMGRPA